MSTTSDTIDPDLIAFVEQITPLVEQRLAPPPRHLFSMGSPVNTGSKIADAGLLAVTAPLQVLTNVVTAPAHWFRPRSKYDNPEYKETPGAAAKDEETDALTLLLAAQFPDTITLPEFFALIPLAYRAHLLPLTHVLYPSYSMLYSNVLNPHRRAALVEKGAHHLRYAHVCLLLEVLLEYWFDQHFLQILWERESTELPPEADAAAPEPAHAPCLLPSPCYVSPRCALKYVTSSAPPLGTAVLDPSVDSAMAVSCTTTWLPGDVGRACATQGELIALIRCVQVQLRHAAGRLDRLGARARLLEDTEAVMTVDTPLTVFEFQALLRDLSMVKPVRLDPARLSSSACIVA